MWTVSFNFVVQHSEVKCTFTLLVDDGRYCLFDLKSDMHMTITNQTFIGSVLSFNQSPSSDIVLRGKHKSNFTLTSLKGSFLSVNSSSFFFFLLFLFVLDWSCLDYLKSWYLNMVVIDENTTIKCCVHFCYFPNVTYVNIFYTIRSTIISKSQWSLHTERLAEASAYRAEPVPGAAGHRLTPAEHCSSVLEPDQRTPPPPPGLPPAGGAPVHTAGVPGHGSRPGHGEIMSSVKSGTPTPPTPGEGDTTGEQHLCNSSHRHRTAALGRRARAVLRCTGGHSSSNKAGCARVSCF